jgi:crossover junction endodeoxyribonuclease RuvC
MGIDPGVALVGYSFLDVDGANVKLIQCGVIKTEAHTPMGERLKTIRADLCELIETFKPTTAAVELLYFTKNVKTGIVVAQARGVIIECLTTHNIKEVKEFTPTALKQILFGHGKADKKDIQMMVSRSLNLDTIIKPDDAADATALALAHLRSIGRL